MLTSMDHTPLSLLCMSLPGMEINGPRMVYDAVVFSDRAANIHAKEGFRKALEQEIYNTFYNGRYSGVMQIMGLSSATGCEIKLIYPDKRHSLLPVMSASYRPRIVGSSQPPRITILMTDMCGWPDRSKEFTVNHFVPMVKIDSTSTTVANEWIEVTRKRQTTRTSKDKPKVKKARSYSRKSVSKVTLGDFFVKPMGCLPK